MVATCEAEPEERGQRLRSRCVLESDILCLEPRQETLDLFPSEWTFCMKLKHNDLNI